MKIDAKLDQQKNRVAPKDGKKHVSIAMQGGGAHGAFTWGVLDRLLEEKDFVVEGVSGASAGGMNAVSVAQGMMDGGNEGAREALRRYWETNIEAGKSSMLKPGLIDVLLHKHTMQNSPMFILSDLLCKFLSPYQFNPVGTNPLTSIVEQLFDFDRLNKYQDVKVFLSATHVYSGKITVFSNIREELSTETMLATACLPTLFHAVLVKGEYYWDGGYTGNPVIYPLIYECDTSDVMLLKLNPTHRNRLPLTAGEIGDRMNEITNNTSIMREMRNMYFLTKLIDEGYVAPGKLKRMNVHLIENEAVFSELGWSSKLNTDRGFIMHLYEEGRKTANKWMEKNYEYIGKKTTADVEEEFVN